MKLLPYDSFALATQCSPAEAVDRLVRLVEPRRLRRPRGPRAEFEGDISETSFRIRPIVNSQTSFLPEFHGRFEPRGDHTLIAVDVIPGTAVLCITAVFFSMVGMLLFEESALNAWLATAATVAASWLISMGGLWFDRGATRRRLAACLSVDGAPTTDLPVSAIQIAKPPRLWAPAVIMLAGAGALAAVQAGGLTITGKATIDLIGVVWTVQFLLFVWVLFQAPLRPVSRVRVLLAMFLVQLAPHLLARVDGFRGDSRPRLAWRWTATPEQRWAEHQRSDRTNRATIAAIGAQRVPGDYPAFRGADRMGAVPGACIDRRRLESPFRPLWRQPVGRGWSSFAVAGERAVTQEQRDEFETVVCYELQSGVELWTHRDRAAFRETMSGLGPRATPTIAGNRIYALGATGILNCLDLESGRRIWSRNILSDPPTENRLYGMCGSPLVTNELVVVCPGGKHASVAAYQCANGRRVWANGNAESSYSSPQLAVLAGRPQVLNFNAEGLYSHDLKTGKVLWSFPWVSNPAEKNNVCQPVPLAGAGKGPDSVLISSGYGQGCARLDVERNAGRFTVRERWSNRNLKSKFSSAVVHDGLAFGLDDGILACIDLNSGERRWKGGRYGHGQLILAGDLLLVQAEQGDVACVEAMSDGYRELARHPALDNRTWNHPALAGNLLLVRNDREAACYELPFIISATSTARCSRVER